MVDCFDMAVLALCLGWGVRLSSHTFLHSVFLLSVIMFGYPIVAIFGANHLFTFPAVDETTDEIFPGLEKLQHLLTDTL